MKVSFVLVKGVIFIKKHIMIIDRHFLLCIFYGEMNGKTRLIQFVVIVDFVIKDMDLVL